MSRVLLFIKGLSVFLVAMSASVSAMAQSCNGEAAQSELACHTWTEIDHAQKMGKTTIIVPVGGTEQSGPYIAVGKHNVRAQKLAEDIAYRLGNGFVAPVVAYVPEGSTTPRRSHMRFPGTLSISPEIFSGLVTNIAESLQVQGFKTIAFVGDHGGYQAQLASIIKKIESRWEKEGVPAHVIYVKAFYDVIPGDYAQKLKSMGLGYALGKHADVSDTSLMLSADSSLVRLEALKRAPKPTIKDGVYGGDPRPATAELGQIGIDMQVDAAVRFIETFNRSSR